MGSLDCFAPLAMTLVWERACLEHAVMADEMIGLLALVAAAFYSGAALYVNLVEQPALLALDDRAALAGWKIALKRGALIQAPLCVIGFLLGLIGWIETRAVGAELGSLAMLAGIPWTVAVILPINKALQATVPEATGERSRVQLQRWYSLHSVRTALGLLALIAFFAALLPG